MDLKNKILAKGFTNVDIEHVDDEDYKLFVTVWFDFIWTDSGKADKGYEQIYGNTDSEIIEKIDNLIKLYSSGDFILKLK